MLVCLCQGVSDRTLRELASKGTRKLKDIKRTCGAGDDCGKCVLQIKRIVNSQADDVSDTCSLPSRAGNDS